VTALLLLAQLPILMLVVLTDRAAKRKEDQVLSKIAFTLAVCAEIPMIVWVHRTVVDESLALYIAYGGAILATYAEYWTVQVVIERVLKRLGNDLRP